MDAHAFRLITYSWNMNVFIKEYFERYTCRIWTVIFKICGFNSIKYLQPQVDTHKICAVLYIIVKYYCHYLYCRSFVPFRFLMQNVPMNCRIAHFQFTLKYSVKFLDNIQAKRDIKTILFIFQFRVIARLQYLVLKKILRAIPLFHSVHGVKRKLRAHARAAISFPTARKSDRLRKLYSQDGAYPVQARKSIY